MKSPILDYRYRPMKSCRSPFVSLVILTSLASAPSAASSLSELPGNIQEDIKTVCLPVQYQEGAQAYRQCVENEVSVMTNATDTPITNLSFDEKYAVQQACVKSGTPASDSYRTCVRQQVAELNAIPKPVVENLSDDEQYALQQTCFEAQSRLGAGPYRRCVNRALSELSLLPVANFLGLSQVAQNGIQLRCSANYQHVVEYRKCLLQAVGSVVTPTTAVQTTIRAQPEPLPRETTIKTASNVIAKTEDSKDISVEKPDVVALTGNTNDTTTQTASTTLDNGDVVSALANQQASVIDDTNKVSDTLGSSTAALDTVAQGNSDDAATNSSVDESDDVLVENTPAPDIRSRANDAWAQMKLALVSLDGMNRILVLSALALPLILIFAWALLRNKRRPEPNYAPIPTNNDLIKRVRPDVSSHDTDMVRQRLDAEADDFFGTLDTDDSYDDGSSNEVDARPSVDTRELTKPLTESRHQPTTAKSAATRIATKPEIANAASIQQGLSERALNAKGSTAADRGEFLTWLEAADSDIQLSYAIEFLIYWVAYGDERYDPALKEVLFQLQDPDDRDLIKRWVLKHDVIAFRDTIAWLQSNTKLVQRQQILDLLMVVLINERALTPVQNTLLRFLGDAFGVGNADLDSQFREAYGNAMAPLPRVDKPKWWQRQHDTSSFRWDARAVAEENLELQYRVRLGQELDGPIVEEEVVKGFRRAARRCHPDRFDMLGDSERELAEIQFEKFEEARDYLLGVDV